MREIGDRESRDLARLQPITDRKGERVSKLIDRLERALLDYDLVYMELVGAAMAAGEKTTEERTRVAVRDEMRKRQMEWPEIVRWRLRAALGGVEHNE